MNEQLLNKMLDSDQEDDDISTIVYRMSDGVYAGIECSFCDLSVTYQDKQTGEIYEEDEVVDSDGMDMLINFNVLVRKNPNDTKIDNDFYTKAGEMLRQSIIRGIGAIQAKTDNE